MIAVITPMTDSDIPTAAMVFLSDLLPYTPATIPNPPITQPRAGMIALHKLNTPNAAEATA